MKKIQPQQPRNVSPYAEACLDALVKANLANRISLGGGLGLLHFLDYRTTHDVDAWWAESLSTEEKNAVVQALIASLSTFGDVRVRTWGDVTSIELLEESKVTFSFQIAYRSARLEEPIRAGWIDIPLDGLADLAASKMTALVERGAPRDFLDIYQLCDKGLLSPEECWSLWRRRQTLAESDANLARARLAIETHLERIALHRPLDKIANHEQRNQAQGLRDWFLNVFLKASHE
ncbi:MAG: hypothetical protein HND47_21935 [Chloroflexi bacterium]|nr:hypothetical protein [Chloroflexota bacterium]